MKSSLTKKELRIIDTDDLKRLKKEIEEELTTRNKKHKPSVYVKPTNPLFSDDDRARYRRVGYDSERF